jgi:hypothetical protein
VPVLTARSAARRARRYGLIAAGIGLIDTATLATLRRFEPFEFRLSIATTIGVLLAECCPAFSSP